MLTRRELLKFSASRKPSRDDYWLHLSRPAMACRFEATLPVSDKASVSPVRNALAEADRLEQQLSIFKEASEVSSINRAAAARAVVVEAALFDLLLLCRKLSRETQGAFDITSGPLSDCWGFLRRQGRIPEPHEVEAARALVGADRLLLDRESRAIRYERPGVRINLGGIGKGYALDRIAARLRNRARSCLLSAGSSSVCAIGSGDGAGVGWKVGVRHPKQKDKRVAVLRMRDCAMATSGSEEQFFEHDGKRYGHIIDPRTGEPADRVASVTVIAQSAAIADALATALFVGGPEMAESYCSTHPDVLVIMLESGDDRAALFGSNERCEVLICE
ncbi:MAG TPA: FAD:protein FMN transferase [Blastocatellia bacterium]|nr:FAD:protein FMN transferase [Blastocatellia bacterium]